MEIGKNTIEIGRFDETLNKGTGRGRGNNNKKGKERRDILRVSRVWDGLKE